MIKLLTKDEVKRHYFSLSPEDRFCRFCSAVSNEFINEYVDRAPGFFYGEVEVAMSLSSFGVEIKAVGVAHIVYDINTKTMEVAVSVLPSRRGQDLGRKLMYFSQGMAEVYKADKLAVAGLGNNSPMINLARSCGYDVKIYQGEFEGSFKTIGAELNTIVDNTLSLFTTSLGPRNGS